MKKIVSLIAIIVTLASCSKDSQIELTDSCSPVDTSFVIGINNESINTVTFNSAIEIIAPSQSYDQFEFDVDNDGINDFKFRSDAILSSGGGNADVSSLMVLNPSFSISTIQMPDTLHQCSFGSIYQTIRYNNYSSYSCTNGVDSILSIELYDYPKIYYSGDTINNSETWLNSNLTLSIREQSSYLWMPPYYTADIIRGNWNYQNMKYILIEKDNGINTLYGWIKISIDNYREIRLHEYALQKE